MRPLPHDSFELDLPDPPSVVASRLAACTGPRQWLPFLAWGVPFQGEVSESEFRVRRVTIWHHNAFRPELRGRFVPAGEGTRVDVTMALPRRDALALRIGTYFMIGVGACLVLSMPWNVESLWQFLVSALFVVLWVLAALFVPWGMLMLSFWLDAPTSRRELTRILNGV